MRSAALLLLTCFIAQILLQPPNTQHPSTGPAPLPSDNSPPQPLGATLSQIIREAKNAHERKNTIDLTSDKSGDERVTEGTSSPTKRLSSETRVEAASSTLSGRWFSSMLTCICVTELQEMHNRPRLRQLKSRSQHRPPLQP